MFERGEIVVIGKSGNIHWEVDQCRNGYVFLVSGMTGRTREEPIANVKRWKPGS